jgi:hypothetical protein
MEISSMSNRASVAARMQLLRVPSNARAKTETDLSDSDPHFDVAGQRQPRKQLSPAALIRYDPHRHRADEEGPPAPCIRASGV